MGCGNSGAESSVSCGMLSQERRRLDVNWERVLLPFMFLLCFILAQTDEYLFYSMVFKFSVIVIFGIEARSSLLQSQVEHSQEGRVDSDGRDGTGGLYYGF